MKLKRSAALALILGMSLLLIGLLMPLLFGGDETHHSGSMGIIGGADGPTYTFMLSNFFGGLPYVFILFGISTVVASGFCLLLSKTVCTHCSIKSSVISLGLSGVGALGLICVFLWLVIVTFGEMSKHPIEYPVSIMLGLLCFAAFVTLIGLYCKVRKTNWSINGLIIDVLTSILYLPTFFSLFMCLYKIMA